MKKKIRVGIIFGGKSAEHEVSLQSAKNVLQALDRNKYEPTLIGITQQGKWVSVDETRFLPSGPHRKLSPGGKKENPFALVSGSNSMVLARNHVPVAKPIDIVFPVLHGPYGEDGTMQGFLKLMDVPFVGAGVLGSAVGMDKDVMKRLLRGAGLPVAKFTVLHRGEKVDFVKVKKALGAPFFVKPANLGSSVGVNKVKNEKEFHRAIKNAFLYDHKILVEAYIKGREIECSVLGNEHPVASLPGEVIPQHEFYSYYAKYVDPKGARFEIPAKVPSQIIKTIQSYAIQAFQVLCAEGMARVDFFLTPRNKIYINEINTIPGFTAISMYPKLWEASGMSCKKLIDTLIILALKRHKKCRFLKHSYGA